MSGSGAGAGTGAGKRERETERERWRVGQLTDPLTLYCSGAHPVTGNGGPPLCGTVPTTSTHYRLYWAGGLGQQCYIDRKIDLLTAE